MKDLAVVLLNQNSNIDTVNTNNGSFFEPIKSLQKWLDDHGVSYDIITTRLDNIPQTIDAKLITFVDGSYMVKNDYIFNGISLNNIHRDMSIIFGPTLIHTKSNTYTRYIKNSYYNYNLNFGSIYTADITDEPHNYGSLYNAIISGSIYNRIGFTGCKTPRSYILDNTAFFIESARYGKVYYSSILQKTKVLTEEDFEIQTISDYYYNLGYLDGVSISCLDEIEKREDLWKKFVESPEVIDSNHPRWLFEEPKTKENTSYLENLVLIKCKYQIGYFEGVLGKRVI